MSRESFQLDPQFETDISLSTFAFATRLLVSELNPERFIEIALETLTDFGKSPRAVFLRVENETDEEIRAIASFDDGKVRETDTRYPIDGSPYKSLIEMKSITPVNGGTLDGLLYPEPVDEAGTIPLLALPVINRRNEVNALVLLQQETEGALSDFESKLLNVMMTLISVAFENTILFQLATVDGLTKLYVRRYFDIRLQEEIARLKRTGGSVALLITDIDHFKSFNDTYGHQQGDIVLSELAVLMKGSVRQDVDIPCRYGGEEFAFILPDTDRDGALLLSERLRTACEEHSFPGQEEPLRVTFSGGVAWIDADHICSREELIKRADSALYNSKENGRNRITAWEP